jgi:hypothetical protein
VIALALMIADLADARAREIHPQYGGIQARYGCNPVSRLDRKDRFPASAEYYRICDRIARGEKP